MYDIQAKETIKWQAFWLHDPVFKNESIIQPIDAKRVKSWRTEKQNVHTLFRKEFYLQDQPIKSAKLYVTADDCYKAYLNEDFIAYGPAQSFCFAYNYNAFEVKSLLVPGLNILALHVFYQGMLNMAFVSADNLNGMICMLEIEYVSKEIQIISSDSSFKCFNLQAYSSDKIYGYETQFSENIDLNLYPYGWMKTNFDDSAWQTPFISGVPYPLPYTLQPQITPTVSFENAYPKTITKKSEGNYLLDFGSEIAGNTVVTANGSKGHNIRIWHAEELTEDKTEARHNMRCGCDYDEVITLSGCNDQAEFYDYKGFRYIEVINYPGDLTKESIYVLHRHYPIPNNHSTLQLDNELFMDIWKMCEKGIIEGTQEAYIDCPTREKGAFLGDGLITGLSHLSYTNDTRILKKFLYDCIHSARVCPGLFCTCITYDASQMIDYSLVLPLMLNKYYHYTKDLDTLMDSLTVLEGIVQYYAQFYRADGILDRIKHVHREQYTVLVDWPVLYRDGYDEKSVVECNCFGNLLYLGILKETAKVYRTVSQPKKADQLEAQAALLEKAIINVFYDYKAGLLKLSETSNYFNFHNGVFALYLDMDLPNGYKPVLDFIKKKGISCGVYFTYYYFSVLYKYKEYDKIFELMVSDERSSWKTMLNSGASTCIEAWHPDDKVNCSLCHPWSSTPMIFTDIFFGISPKEPGFSVMSFSPRIPKHLNSGTYTKPTPLSDVTVTFKRENSSSGSSSNKIHYELVLKQDCRLYVSLKDGQGYYMDAKAGSLSFTEEVD